MTFWMICKKKVTMVFKKKLQSTFQKALFGKNLKTLFLNGTMAPLGVKGQISKARKCRASNDAQRGHRKYT